MLCLLVTFFFRLFFQCNIIYCIFNRESPLFLRFLLCYFWAKNSASVFCLLCLPCFCVFDSALKCFQTHVQDKIKDIHK